MTWLRVVRGWLIDPVATVRDPETRRNASLYAAFVMIVASFGLTLGFWIYPDLQGAEVPWENATWRGASLAAVGFVASYALARLGRLPAAAHTVVVSALLGSYVAAFGAPEILLFMNTGVVIASAVLPLRAMGLAAAATLLAPVAFSVQSDSVAYVDLAYVQGVNLMVPALLLLVGWYREQLVRERRSRDARLAELVQNSPDGIVTLDADGRVSSCNPSMERLSGFAAHELIGASAEDLGLPEKVDGGPAGYGARVVGLLRKDGRELAVECLLTRVEDTVFGDRLQLMVRDVEERERGRAAQERLEAQLQEARRLEALGRLAGGIAHDLNNQLTVMLVGMDFMSLEGASGDLVAIRRAADHSRRLVAQLLTFARGQPRHVQPLVVDALVAKLTPILHTMVREDIELQLVPGAPGAAVLADRTQLEQVVLNLVANGSDAMPDGGTLRVSTSRRAVTGDAPLSKRVPPGEYVILEVLDDGQGIPEEALERLFEPFFTTKFESSGTGLGLATVHGVVTQSGGVVFAENRASGGAAFRVMLPEHHPSFVDADDAPALEAEVDWQDTVALVVDDQPQVGEVVKRILDRLGCRTIYERDPVRAVDLFERSDTRIDVLITDVVMPGMKGPELVRRLRSFDPDLKVVIMSGYPGQEEVSGERFLPKPFTPSDVRRAVAEALSG